jgi:hypothetical protein
MSKKDVMFPVESNTIDNWLVRYGHGCSGTNIPICNVELIHTGSKSVVAKRCTFIRS